VAVPPLELVELGSEMDGVDIAVGEARVVVACVGPKVVESPGTKVLGVVVGGVSTSTCITASLIKLKKKTTANIFVKPNTQNWKVSGDSVGFSI
jgi:hypothetical protein